MRITAAQELLWGTISRLTRANIDPVSILEALVEHISGSGTEAGAVEKLQERFSCQLSDQAEGELDRLAQGEGLKEREDSEYD